MLREAALAACRGGGVQEKTVTNIMHIYSAIETRSGVVSPDRQGHQALSKKRLMVVDDQVSLTRIVDSIARDMGLDVKVINDPTEALDAFLSFRPDILLLDMVMPEKDGVDVLQELMLTGVDSKIILTSGFTESYARLAEDVASFHNKGPLRLLKRPFRRDHLMALLREVMAED